MIDVIAPCLNFLVVVGILVYFGRAPIRDYFQGRSDVLSKSVKEAEVASRQAGATKQEWENKLKEAKSEMVSRQSEVQSLLQRYRTEVLARAAKEAERIHQDSRLLAEGERVRAANALRKEVSEECIASVRKFLASSLEDKDKKDLVTEYLTLVERAPAMPS